MTFWQQGIDQMTSRADQHDLEKLARWLRDLEAGASSSFPVYAIFLVSPDDRAAHDIFRKFRSSFEARGAGFANLVIFGQHGLSSTVRALLPELGLPPEATPSLVVVARSDPAVAYSLPLPPGDEEPTDGVQPDEPWQPVLARVEEAADKGAASATLAALDGLTRTQMTAGSLSAVVDRLLADLG